MRGRWADRVWLAMATGMLLGIAAALVGWGAGSKGMTLIGVGVAFSLAMPVCAFINWRTNRGLWMMSIVIVPLYLSMAAMGFADLFRPDVRPSGQLTSVLGSTWVLLCTAATVFLAYANWSSHRQRIDNDTNDDGHGSTRGAPRSPPPPLLGAMASGGYPGQHPGQSARVR